MDPTYELDQLVRVQTLVKERLGEAWKRMQTRGLDLKDPLVWWEQVRVHGILHLETNQGSQERVAAWLETLESRAYGVLEQVKREPYPTLRSELKIDRHWVFWVPRYPLDTDTWCDVFYSTIDQSGTCLVIPLATAGMG
ncbi:MAG: hypothetical protein Q6K59_00235 [Gloeomargarita sp. GMQP_bins_25]